MVPFVGLKCQLLLGLHILLLHLLHFRCKHNFCRGCGVNAVRLNGNHKVSSHIKPGVKVLYLGAASCTTVSHVSDIVGPNGLVYAVEFSHRSGRDLINLAKKRTNIIPVIDDARHPHKYRMLIAMVDVIFADVAQPDQTRIVALNSHTFLRNGGLVS